MRVRSLLLFAVVALGCEGGSSALPDAETPPAISVDVLPSDGARTNDTGIAMEALVDGGVPTEVSFWVDGVEVFSTSTPTNSSGGYFYTWQPSASDAEGAHSFQAKAVINGFTFSSPRRSLIIDRTSPTLSSVAPDAGSTVCLASAFAFHFSEPMLHRPDSGIACMPGPCRYDPLVAFRIEDGGVVDATTVLTDGDQTMVATLNPPDGGSPGPGYGGSLTAESTSLLEDVVGNPVVPFTVRWQVQPDCVTQ